MNALGRWNQLRWDQLNELEALRRGLRSLASHSCVDWPEQHLRAPQWIPLVVVRENAHRYILTAELPEVKQKDVEITIDDGTLTITGERRFNLNRKKDHPAEQAYGRFAHSFEMPVDARPAKVNAVFKDGVLTVHLAKSSVSISPPALASCSSPTLRLNRRDQFNEPERETKSSCHVIMSHILKSFAELSWPVVALDTIANRDLSLQLLASIPPRTLLGTGTPPVAAVQRRRALLAQVDAWHHGGINE